MRSLAFVASLALCAACSVERTPGTFAPQDFADTGGVDAPATVDAALGAGAGAGTMTGTWLLVHEASTCVVVDEQVTWGSYLLEIEQQGRVLTEARRECELTLSPVFGLQMVASDAALGSLAFHEVDKGLVSAPTVGGTYNSSTEVGLWGIELNDPLADEVPTEPDDPAVFDSDGDGNPGVTLQAAGTSCERWLAHRQVVRYFGTFTQPNQIDGTSLTATESNVIGSSMPLCGVNPRITANDEHSRFRMVRVDGAGESVDLDADGDGTISCEEAAPWFERVLERREQDAANCD